MGYEVGLVGRYLVEFSANEKLIKKIGAFDQQNRAGIDRTLHRISLLQNRTGEPIGLTIRVGRAVLGAVDAILDIIRLLPV